MSPAGYREQALLFECEGESLLGVVSHPRELTGAGGGTGVLVIVGGPQYRAGAHRQFVILARHLAVRGVPCMRFDYRGMGDSYGGQRSFEQVEADIAAAIAAFFAASPCVRRVVLWGLCDGASAACLYPAGRDPRVAASVLVNPWVHSAAGQARVFLKHYYLQRLLDPNFWKKLFGGRVSVLASLRSLMAMVRSVGGGKPVVESAPAGNDMQSPPALESLPLAQLHGTEGFQARMAAGLAKHTGLVGLFLSGRDYVAQEFLDARRSSPEWRKVLACLQVTDESFPDADHTFSGPGEAELLAERTHDWLLTRGLLSG